jgi:hypothetical protein
MGKENIKDMLTSGRARNMERQNYTGNAGTVYRFRHSKIHYRKTGMEWKSSKITKKIFEIKLEGRRRKRRRGRPKTEMAGRC